METYGISYDEGSAEYDKKLEAFTKSLQAILKINLGALTYVVAPNAFSALTLAEFVAKVGGLRGRARASEARG